MQTFAQYIMGHWDLPVIGASSGLHHDFHDNLYLLLRGRKRFRLFPPQLAHRMATHGRISIVHANGCIVYEGQVAYAFCSGQYMLLKVTTAISIVGQTCTFPNKAIACGFAKVSRHSLIEGVCQSIKFCIDSLLLAQDRTPGPHVSRHVLVA